MSNIPSALDGHRLPVEASPALRHHQQVEGATMLLIICLKEIVGLWHEALDFAGQEHLRKDIATVERIVGVDRIAHSQRDMLVWHQAGRSIVEVNALKRLVLLLVTSQLERRLRQLGMGNEKEAVGIDMPDGIEDGDLIYPSWQIGMDNG